MISRERLEELKYNTIYSTFGSVSRIYLDNDTFLKDDKLYEKDRKYGDLFVGNLNNLYETKEDAEEYLQYGNRTRIVKFEAPTWEELQRMVNSTTEWNVDFCIDCSHKQDLIVSVCRTIGTMDKEQPYIIRLRQFGECKEIDFEYSREGYNKARDLCLELFYGKRSVL